MRTNLNHMYKLPWTKEDNPNGWIEPTTHCQLKCPGCFRGLSEKNAKHIHQNFDKIKSDINLLIKTRNIQTISIGGGEPLLYPQIKEVIKYAFSKGLKIKIFTNGLLLTKKKLIEFRDAGVTEFVVHVNKYQNRPDIKKKNFNELREKFCRLFREVGNINLGFIIPISGENYSDLEETIGLCKKNSDVVNLLIPLSYKDALSNKDRTFLKNKLRNPNISHLSNYLAEKFESEPCAYLGKRFTKDQPSWIFIVPVFYGEKIIGYLDSYLYQKFQERYKRKKGKYFITIKGNKINYWSLIRFIFRKSVLKIILNLIREKFKDRTQKKLSYQVILIHDGPDKINGKWDLCESCPDAMYYKGKLVPSCLLERVKEGEKIFV